MLYMLTAGKKALADAGLTEDMMKDINKTKCGVLIGSAMGGMKVEHLVSAFTRSPWECDILAKHHSYPAS